MLILNVIIIAGFDMYDSSADHSSHNLFLVSHLATFTKENTEADLFVDKAAI